MDSDGIHQTGQALNGITESAVKQIKSIIKKCNNENNDLWLYWNSPSKSLGMSSFQRLFGRQLRSVFPTMKKNSCPYSMQK